MSTSPRTVYDQALLDACQLLIGNVPQFAMFSAFALRDALCDSVADRVGLPRNATPPPRAISDKVREAMEHVTDGATGLQIQPAGFLQPIVIARRAPIDTLAGRLPFGEWAIEVAGKPHLVLTKDGQVEVEPEYRALTTTWLDRARFEDPREAAPVIDAWIASLPADGTVEIVGTGEFLQMSVSAA